MSNANLDVTKFLAEITGLSVPATTTEAGAATAGGGTCPCGQPKMAGDRAVYCAHHSKQGSLVFSHLPGEHRNWRQALAERNFAEHARIEGLLITTVGGQDAYTALMNAPRRPVAFRSPKKATPAPTATAPPPPAPTTKPSTGQVHTASMILKLDAAILALAELRQELSATLQALGK